MGDTSCVVIAESPRGAVFNTPNSVIGETTLTVGEGKTSTSGAFRNIGIGLSAPKTSLLKGEKTTLTVQVLGLSGIKEPLIVEMVATGPVNTDGGNNQNIEIKPSQVKGDGMFSMTRDLTAIEAGPFNVAVSLIRSP